VNNPEDHSLKSFNLKYELQWTRDMSATTQVLVHLLDISGGTRAVKGQLLEGIEWNIDQNLNNKGDHQNCNDTICNITGSVVVGEQHNFETGLCAGTMRWSYLHQHVGAISGTMYVNGKQHCQSLPIVGTDPSNPAGNEQGFVVKFTQCVDQRTLGNQIRLNKGDVVTVTGLYDVDPTSKRNFPLPGGKHGGVMGLFFSVMQCDAGTWGEAYVCRNSTCVGVPSGRKGEYKNLAQCEAACGQEPMEDPRAVVDASVQAEEPLSIHVGDASNQTVKIGKLAVTFKDCGDANTHGKISTVTPHTLRLGSINTIEGAGVIDQDFSAGNFTIKMVAGVLGLTLVDISGDICEKQKPFATLLGLIHINWDGLDCPLKAGSLSVKLRLRLNELIPVQLAQTTTTVIARTPTGEKIFCAEVFTDGIGELEYSQGVGSETDSVLV